MKRYTIFIAILSWLSSLAIVAIVSTRIATNEAKKQHDPFTVEEIIKIGSGWQYTIAIQYADGGSWNLGFLDNNGLFLFVNIDYSLGAVDEYRKFYLRKSLIGNRDSTEVIRGSDLESKVINLIEESRDLNTEKCKVLPEKSAVADLLKSRDIRIKLDNPRIDG